MKYLILGAGLQGTAIAFDLLRHAAGTTMLTVVDQDREALDRLEARLNDTRLHCVAGDATDELLLAPLWEGVNTAISAVNYWHNYPLAVQAVAHRAHFVDLGGNHDVVVREFSLDAEARRQGVTIIPDCGLAPGMVNILAHHLHGSFDEVENLRLRVGGIPLQPRPPLNYQLVFAVQGLINEYCEPCQVVRDGELQSVPALSELESVRFPAPFGELEAFQTSGGCSTLPRTLQGKVRNLDYKTIRYRGHCEKCRLLLDLGLTGAEPVRLRNMEIVPREFLGMMLEKSLGFAEEDVTLVLIEAEGKSGGTYIRRSIRIIDHGDRKNGISAMMRTTGYPAAIIAAMLAAGEIAAPGAHPQELAVPAERFLAELDRRDITLQWSEEPLAGTE